VGPGERGVGGRRRGCPPRRRPGSNLPLAREARASFAQGGAAAALQTLGGRRLGRPLAEGRAANPRCREPARGIPCV